jgi:hypothetical protein
MTTTASTGKLIEHLSFLNKGVAYSDAQKAFRDLVLPSIKALLEANGYKCEEPEKTYDAFNFAFHVSKDNSKVYLRFDVRREWHGGFMRGGAAAGGAYFTVEGSNYKNRTRPMKLKADAISLLDGIKAIHAIQLTVDAESRALKSATNRCTEALRARGFHNIHDKDCGPLERPAFYAGKQCIALDTGIMEIEFDVVEDEVTATAIRMKLATLLTPSNALALDSELRSLLQKYGIN